LRRFPCRESKACRAPGEVGRDPLHLGDDPIEGLLQPQVGAQRLEAASLTELRDDILRVLAGGLCLLADQLLDLVVGDLDPELVGGGLEHQLAGDRLRRLGANALGELLRRLAGQLQVEVGTDPAAVERAAELIEQLTRTCLDERA
jgi:hypothetical protein